MRRVMVDGLVAGAVAGTLSGVPSTAWALVRREDPLAATLAAGSLLLPRETRRGRLLVAAVVAHTGLSLGWGAVLAAGLPDRRPIAAGAVAGLVIAAIDLGLVGRALPRIRQLPLWPQIADHLAYGVLAAVIIQRRSRAAPATRLRPRLTG